MPDRRRRLVRLDEEWRESAACKNQFDRSDIWLPDDSRVIPPEAKAICSTCFVAEECLEFALALEGNAPAHARAGIWAGTSPVDRVKLWRSRKGRTIVEPHKPEWRRCACGCGRAFDRWRTIEGKAKRVPRSFATKECQLDFMRGPVRPRNTRRVVCKAEGCENEFNPFFTFAGSPTTSPRVYCGPACRKAGASAQRSETARRAKTDGAVSRA